MKAYLKNYRQSPRKARIVADLIRGKSVRRALVELKFLRKRASDVFIKIIKSAVSNAKENNNLDEDKLFVKSIMVDGGPSLKRIKARARGAAHLIKKRTSNITLELGEMEESSKKKNQKKEVTKERVKSTKKTKVSKK